MQDREKLNFKKKLNLQAKLVVHTTIVKNTATFAKLMCDDSTTRDIQNSLLPYLSQVGKQYSALITSTFKEHGLNLSREQMIILKHLSGNEGLIQNDLAFITNRDKTTLTRIINGMEKKGLLNRKSCPHDSRRNRIFITKKGQEQYNQGFPLVRRIADAMENNLDKEEILATIETLKKVSNNLRELEHEKK